MSHCRNYTCAKNADVHIKNKKTHKMQSLWCLYWNIPGYICQYYGCGHPFALDICSRCYVCMLVFRIFAACKVVVITVHLMQPRCRSNTIHDLNLARGVSFVQVIKHEPCLEAGPADSHNSDICSMIHVGLASNTGVNVHDMEWKPSPNYQWNMNHWHNFKG